MKKIFMSMAVIGLLVVSMFGVMAAGVEEEIELPEPGRIGFFENMFDHIKLGLTFNKEKRVERALEMAERRLAEAEVLAENDPEGAERAREKYEFFLAKAEGAVAGMDEIGWKPGPECKSNNSLGENQTNCIGEPGEYHKLVRSQNKIEAHREKVEAMHLRVLEKFESKNISEERIAKLEELFEKSNARLDKSEEKILQKKENARVRYKVLSEEDEDELNAALRSVEDDEGLSEARERRKARAEVRVEKREAIREMQTEKLRAKLSDSNLTEEHREQIQKRIENFELGTGEYAETARKTQGRD